ncbi:hypothetical protein BACCIP111899_03028 [Bacillus rhizoplanae]|uniref:Uncharacterized protein n=1 Tax=Bacillus rhizoplanae TaxID=2880966 RepID=A0ABM8YDD0_9BACI|nr:hypothetical protein [Bacillus rhizoplanae]CAG9613809.1 hypothetical protein BACCIP111899_03028 [Bacillus rhizoplanae]
MKLTLKEQKLKDRLVKDYSNRNNDRKKPDIEYDAFVRLLKALIDDGDIKDEKAIQISNILMESSPNTLSIYEWKHFYEYGVGEKFFVNKPCTGHNRDIPWEDMYAAYIHEDALCVNCRIADASWDEE